MIRLDTLPSPQRRALELVKDVSAEKGCRPYLVGGPVRDLLLERRVMDIDLTLEEGSSSLARALAKRIDGRVRSYPQFLTYKVTAEDFPEIDIATTRTEKYRQPGALPAVSAGRLQDDLLRRDFSINAIALDVLSLELHDPTGGENDLEKKVVRVLHDDSFTDDPTRIFRAIRLAIRLGFKIDSHTETLMRKAIRGRALETVSRERLWRELFLAFDEEKAPRIVGAFNAAGALEVLFGKRQINRARLERVRQVVESDATLDREVLYTSALLYGNASPVDLEGSGLSQRRARNVIQIANELPRFTDALSEATSDRQRFRLLKHASPELLGVMAATTAGDSVHIARFHDYQRFRLPLRGTELEMPLGPHIAKALERTREAVFMGEIEPAEARSFARQMAIKYLSREQAAESK
jgi:tRNA nucleotidyltransferase (CCA-adding enzyme)